MSNPKAKKTYAKPSLERLGSVGALTAGGSLDENENMQNMEDGDTMS